MFYSNYKMVEVGDKFVLKPRAGEGARAVTVVEIRERALDENFVVYQYPDGSTAGHWLNTFRTQILRRAYQ